MLSLNVLFLGLSLVVIDATPVKLDEATSKLIETSYNQGLRSGANNRLAGRAKRELFPSYDGVNKIPITLDDYSDVLPAVPHPISSSKQDAFSLKSKDRTEVEESDSHQGIGAVSKKGYHSVLPPLHGDFPAPLPAPVIAVVPVTPVKIMKPNLGAGRAHVTNFDDMGLAQTKNATPESIVQKSQILAPAPNFGTLPEYMTGQNLIKVNMFLYGTPERPLSKEEKKAFAIMNKLCHNALCMLKRLSPPPPSAGTNTPPPPPATKAAPAPVQIAAAPVHVVPHAFETRVHYADIPRDTPVVVGHSAQILKPNLTPFAVAHPLVAPTVAVVPSVDSTSVVVEAKKDETLMEAVETVAKDKKVEEVPSEKATAEVKTSSVPLTYVSHHPFAYAAPAPLTFAAHPHFAYAAPTVLDLKASVPAGDAPSMDVLVTKQKVLAPVRAISEVTPQVTVQHPTKVNIDKVAVEVLVATPYALYVPVPVAPQYEIHHVHTPALAVVA